jgi:RecA/RadA recombinase
MKFTQNARINKTKYLLSKPSEFKEQLDKEIASFSTSVKKHKFKPAVRLNGLSDIVWEKKFPELFDTQLSNDAIHRLETLFSKIEIRKVLTSEELNNDIASMETQDFIVERGIKLIVVDSIAYLLRHESFDEKSREMKLIAPAANLKAIADKVGLVVLVTNQITQVESDCFDNNDKFGDTFQQSTTTFRPYLGPTWSHCTSCRIVMRCDADNFQLPDMRFIEIAKSPLAPKSTLNYKITDSGISCDLV